MIEAKSSDTGDNNGMANNGCVNSGERYWWS